MAQNYEDKKIPFLNDQTSHKTEVLESLPSLSIDISDESLAQLIRRRVESSDNYWDSQVNLWNRQKKLENYLYGKQFDLKEFHPSEKPFMENIMWEGWTRNRSILMSRMPTIDVNSTVDKDPASVSVARKLSNLINTRLQSKELKNEASKTVMNRPIYLYGIMKAVWDKEIDNFTFISINPKNVIVDHTATNKNKVRFYCEKVKTSIEEVVMMFPDKADLFKNYVMEINKWKDISDNQMSSPMTIWEVWFEEYVKVGEKYEKIVGVVWQYNDFILKKMKHPYWDWSGQKKLFIKTPEGVRPPTEDEVYKSLFENDPSVQADTIYNNFLKTPEFPYYLCTLNSGSENVLDATTDFEQIIYFQDNINREGVQIATMNSRSYGKDVFNADAFEDESSIAKIDPRNVNQVIKVRGEDVNKVYSHIAYPQPSAQLYKSKSDNRNIGFEMLALNATTRGVRDTGDETLGAKQMMREQDFGVLDYEVSMTLNDLMEWMARWSMHFIKLFYKAPHYVDVIGPDGNMVSEAFSSDMISDGVLVKVSASSINKEKKYAQAVADAQNGMSDPLSYFEDTEQEDPKGRATRMIMFKMAPQIYMQQYLGETAQAGIAGLTQTLNPAAPQVPPAPAPQPPMV